MSARGLILTVESSGRRMAAGEECTLGRASHNTLSFPEDETMSREHARIRRQGEVYVLSDRGTRNGSFLLRDGEQRRVTEVELAVGDVIVVGAARIRVSAADEEADLRTVINDPGLTSVPDATRVGGVLPDLGGPGAEGADAGGVGPGGAGPGGAGPGRAGPADGAESPGPRRGSRRRGWRRMLPGRG